MRIDLVLWSGEFGGAETFTASLAEQMRVEGHEARVVFVTHGRPLAYRLERAAIPWTELGLSRGSRVLGVPRAFATLLKDADVVLLPTSGYLAAVTRLGGYVGALVSVEHNGALIDPACGTRSGRLVRACNELVGMWAVDAQVAVSDALADYLRNRRQSSLIQVIHNGVPVPAMCMRERQMERPVIGAAGRLVAGKGFPELIRAAAPLVLGGHAELRIAGNGPLLADLRLMCERAGVDPESVLLGSRSDMQEVWAGCDIAVVPSNELVESFGMVAVEAMAAGLPVVATSQPALSQVVQDGVSGTLVRPGDVQAMHAAIARYVDDGDLRLRHGAAARERAQCVYDITICANRYVELFEHVLADQRA